MDKSYVSNLKQEMWSRIRETVVRMRSNAYKKGQESNNREDWALDEALDLITKESVKEETRKRIKGQLNLQKDQWQEAMGSGKASNEKQWLNQKIYRNENEAVTLHKEHGQIARGQTHTKRGALPL